MVRSDKWAVGVMFVVSANLGLELEEVVLVQFCRGKGVGSNFAVAVAYFRIDFPFVSGQRPAFSHLFPAVAAFHRGLATVDVVRIDFPFVSGQRPVFSHLFSALAAFHWVPAGVDVVAVTKACSHWGIARTMAVLCP